MSHYFIGLDALYMGIDDPRAKSSSKDEKVKATFKEKLLIELFLQFIYQNHLANNQLNSKDKLTIIDSHYIKLKVIVRDEIV